MRIFKLIVHSAVLFGVMTVMTGAFQGAGRTLLVMALELGRTWLLRLPIAYVLANTLAMRADGIWWAMAISNDVVALLGIGLFLRGRWKLEPLVLRTRKSGSPQETEIYAR